MKVLVDHRTMSLVFSIGSIISTSDFIKYDEWGVIVINGELYNFHILDDYGDILIWMYDSNGQEMYQASEVNREWKVID
jgi:hypothetical protein